MTETTSSNAKQDVDDDAQSKTATDNERVDPQKIQSSQHGPNIELTPPTNPDSALTTINGESIASLSQGATYQCKVSSSVVITSVPESSPQGGSGLNPVSDIATSKFSHRSGLLQLS